MKHNSLLLHGYFSHLISVFCQFFFILQEGMVYRYPCDILNLFKGKPPPPSFGYIPTKHCIYSSLSTLLYFCTACCLKQNHSTVSAQAQISIKKNRIPRFAVRKRCTFVLQRDKVFPIEVRVSKGPFMNWFGNLHKYLMNVLYEGHSYFLMFCQI